jgi:hypothetical protein
MDIFASDAFSTVSLTTAVNKVDYKPQLLSAMGLFTPRPVRTEKVAVEMRDQTLSLVQTSARGAPLDPQNAIKRTVRDFRTVRIAKGDTLMADEVQGIRAFGSETELQQVVQEVAERQARLIDDIELTKENMLLGAVQGVLADADASTIYNWFTELGVAQAAEIDFDLDNASPASGALMKKCDQVVTQMRQAAKGAFIGGTRVIGLCGTAFWRDLIGHTEIHKLWELTTLYGDQTGLAALLGLPANGVVEYGGVTFIRYWGTDDDSTVAISTNECKFFPMGARDAFEIAYAPMESFTYVNTPGLPLYSMLVPDRDRNMSVGIEVYSYPLPICTRPGMLQRAKRT